MHARTLRKLLRLLILPLYIVTLSTLIVSAQPERTLESGSSVTGILDGNNVAQVYTFAANAGDTVTVSAESETGLGLALLVTDTNGATVAQGFESGGVTTLADVALSQSGNYYVTVLSALGVTLPAGSTFELNFVLSSTTEPDDSEVTAPVEATPTLEPVAVPTIASASAETFAPGQILTVNGMQVSLEWSSLANLDLEVRDPVGGSVFFATPNVPSGGQFGVNVNSACNTRSADAPTEQVVWPSGVLPTGSYELLVYYQPLDDCPTTDPTSFTVTVQLDNEVIDTIQGNLLPNEVFISSVVVGPEGSLTAGASGLYTDTTVLPVPLAQLVSNPQPIERDVPVTGLLTSSNYYDTYTFSGQANELVTINMNATSGSLDTLVLLLDSAGNVIGSNDDQAQGNTDSSIANFRLFTSGTYSVVATRYGKDVGGTEGNYTLLLTGPTGDLPQEVLNLGLPRGDVEIVLSWNTAADVQLLVRDPRGDSVFDDTPTVPSGGRLAAAGNVNCTPAQTSPVSYVYWPEGLRTPGLYEVEVWYQNPCNDTNPLNFALNILVDGTPVFTDTRLITQNQIYLTSFVIGLDGQVETGDGGFIGTRQGAGGQQLDVTSLDFRAELPNATAVFSGQSVSGSITNEDKFDLYTFEGEAGDVINVSMVATAGRLDTVLFLLDPNGFQIADNDDAVVGESTDSLISEFTLPEDGQYTIVATHFGMQFGGTTGAYNLTFSRLN